MATKKTSEKSARKPGARLVTRATLVKGSAVPLAKVRRVAVPEPVTDVVTENTYITTEPEVEIRKPGTLAQALTEPAEVVVKRRTTVRRLRAKTRRVA